MSQLADEDLIEMYRLMLLTRRFEEKTAELHEQAKIAELPHTGVGHEAIGVGACYSLRKDDLVQPYFRERSAWFTKGISPKMMMLELFGKKAASAKGKTTYLHLIDPERGLIGSVGVVGSSMPIATGAALAIKLRKEDRVVLTFFGDGASNRGDFHESLNFAAIWKLPVIFVCENNRIAISVTTSKSMAVKNIADRAIAYGIPGVSIDGCNVLAIYDAVQEAVRRAREQNGPTLIEAKCQRLRAHAEGIRESRHKDEVESLCSMYDPVKNFGNYLLEKGILTQEEMRQMEKKLVEEIEEAVRFAEKSPFPEPSEALKDVYEDESIVEAMS
jgi:pyruvate dehydrogenase E1 component alpha subunit